jgi:hypothetical protein
MTMTAVSFYDNCITMICALRVIFMTMTTAWQWLCYHFMTMTLSDSSFAVSDCRLGEIFYDDIEWQWLPCHFMTIAYYNACTMRVLFRQKQNCADNCIMMLAHCESIFMTMTLCDNNCAVIYDNRITMLSHCETILWHRHCMTMTAVSFCDNCITMICALRVIFMTIPTAWLLGHFVTAAEEEKLKNEWAFL